MKYSLLDTALLVQWLLVMHSRALEDGLPLEARKTALAVMRIGHAVRKMNY